MCYKSRIAQINFPTHTVYLPQGADDASLIGRCLRGDEGAFETLVTRYQRVLFNVALRMLGDREDARDATQNTFVKAYQNLKTFDGAHRFFSWVYRILLNECLNVRRARRPHAPIVDVPARGEGPLDALETAERRRQVQAAVLTLPTEYREVIILRHFAALSYDEIGATLGIPAKTVKSRLHTARQRLGQLLCDWSPRE